MTPEAAAPASKPSVLSGLAVGLLTLGVCLLALEGVVFTNVRLMSLHDSGIADVAAVEVRDDLIVEGVKPSVPS